MTERKMCEQWDFVDNAIFDLIQTLNPKDTEIEWDIEPISEIRQILIDLYVEKLQLCTEYEFYPYEEIPI
jgi:hypothetical protein